MSTNLIKNTISLLEQNDGQNFELISNQRNQYLIISGFNPKLDGTKIKGGKNKVSCDFETLAGNYTIKMELLRYL